MIEILPYAPKIWHVNQWLNRLGIRLKTTKFYSSCVKCVAVFMIKLRRRGIKLKINQS